jgi:hypothetical protein
MGGWGEYGMKIENLTKIYEKYRTLYAGGNQEKIPLLEV